MGQSVAVGVLTEPCGTLRFLPRVTGLQHSTGAQGVTTPGPGPVRVTVCTSTRAPGTRDRRARDSGRLGGRICTNTAGLEMQKVNSRGPFLYLSQPVIAHRLKELVVADDAVFVPVHLFGEILDLLGGEHRRAFRDAIDDFTRLRELVH